MNPNYRRNSSTPNESSSQQQQLQSQQHHVQSSLDAGSVPLTMQANWKKQSPELGSIENVNKENNNAYGNHLKQIYQQQQSLPSTPMSFMGRKIAGTPNLIVLKSQKTTTTSSSSNSASKKFPMPLSQKNSSKQRSRAESFQRTNGTAGTNAAMLAPLILEEEFLFGGDGSVQFESSKIAAMYSNNNLDGTQSMQRNNQQQQFASTAKNLPAHSDHFVVHSTKSSTKGSQKVSLSSRFPNSTKAQNSSSNNGTQSSQIDAFFKNEYPTSKRLSNHISSSQNGHKQQAEKKLQRSLERQAISNTAAAAAVAVGSLTLGTVAIMNSTALAGGELQQQQQQTRKTITKQSNNIKSSGTFVVAKKKSKKKTIQSLKGLSQAQTTSQDMNTISQHISDVSAMSVAGASASAGAAGGSQISPAPSHVQQNQTKRSRQSGSFLQSDSTQTVKHIEKSVFDLQQMSHPSRNNNHFNKEQLDILSQHQQQQISQNQGSLVNDQSQTLYTANTATFEASGTIDADELRMELFKKPKSLQDDKRNRQIRQKKVKARLVNGQSRSKSNGKKSNSFNSTSSSNQPNQTFLKTKMLDISRNSSNTLEFSQQYGQSTHLKSSLNSSSIPTNGKRPERSSSEGKRNANFNQISIDNLKKKRLQELVSRQVEIQNDKDRLEKKVKQQIENDQIRIQNALRFQKQRIREPAMFPWGFNQQKIRMSLENQLRREERSQERQIQQQFNLQMNDDNVRRERLGLSFMNNLDESTILNLKRSSQPFNSTAGANIFSAAYNTMIDTPSNAQQQQLMQQQQMNAMKFQSNNNNNNNTSAKAKSLEEQQYLQAFIEFKKHVAEEHEREQQITKLQEKQRIEDNLKRLNETIKRQQRSCRSKSFTKKRCHAGGSLHLSQHYQQQQYMHDSQLGSFVPVHFGPQTLQPFSTNQLHPVVTKKARSASNGEYRVADADLLQRKLSEIAFHTTNLNHQNAVIATPGAMDNFDLQQEFEEQQQLQQQQQQHDDQRSSQATEGNFTDRKFSVLNSEFKNIITQALYDQEQKRQQEFSLTNGGGVIAYGVPSNYAVIGKSPIDKSAAAGGGGGGTGTATTTTMNQSMLRPSSKEQSAQKTTFGGTGEIFSATGSSPNAFNSTNQSLQLKKQRIYQKFMLLENKFHSLYNDTSAAASAPQHDFKSPVGGTNAAAVHFNDSSIPLLPASAFKDLDEYQGYLATLSQTNPELAKQYFSLLSNPPPLNSMQQQQQQQHDSEYPFFNEETGEHHHHHHHFVYPSGAGRGGDSHEYDSNHDDEGQENDNEDEEEEEVFPDLPSENDIVDEDLVIDEFKSSSSSEEEGSLKKMKSIGNRSYRNQTASNKKAIRSIMNGGVAVAAGSRPLSESSSASDDEGENASEWDESMSSQDMSRSRKGKSSDFKFQASHNESRSIQEMKDDAAAVSMQGSQNYNSSAQKSNNLNTWSKQKQSAGGDMLSDEMSSSRVQQQQQQQQYMQQQQASYLKDSNSPHGYSSHGKNAQTRTDEFDLDFEEMKNLREIRDIEQLYNNTSKNQQSGFPGGGQAGQRGSTSVAHSSAQKSTPLHATSVVIPAAAAATTAARTPVGHHNNHLSLSKPGTALSSKKSASAAVVISPDDAAVLIQKVWKGFQTRRIVRYHLQMYEEEQYIGTGELSEYDELTEEQEDELLRQQILEYLVENNEEWTEEEFEDYFLKFKAKNALEKQQQQQLARRANHPAGSAKGSAAAVIPPEQDYSEDGLLHTDDLLMDEELYIKSAQRYQQMREKQSQLLNDPMQINYDELMRIDQSKVSHPHSQRAGIAGTSGNHTGGISEKKYSSNKPKGDANVAVPVGVAKAHSDSEDYRDDFSDNIMNNDNNNIDEEGFDNSRSDQLNKQQDDQDLLNFLKKGVQMFGEKQASNLHSTSKKNQRMYIEDENGEMVELDFMNLPGMETTKNFKESMSGGSRLFYDSQDEVGGSSSGGIVAAVPSSGVGASDSNNLDSGRNATKHMSLAEQQRREKEFNQVQQVGSMKRKVNLGILVNDDDFDVYSLGHGTAAVAAAAATHVVGSAATGSGVGGGAAAVGGALNKPLKAIDEHRGFTAAPFRDAKPTHDVFKRDRFDGDYNNNSDASHVNIGGNAIAGTAAMKTGEKVIHYNNYMENLEFSSKNSPSQLSDEYPSQKCGKDEISQGQEVLGGKDAASVQNEGEYEEEIHQEQEEYDDGGEFVDEEELSQQQQQLQLQQGHQVEEDNNGQEDGQEDDEEEEVEEFEIDLDHLLTKSQYEDEEGNVFIYEQGQQIYLGEEELQMIEDYARQKMLEQKANQQQQQSHQESQLAEERSSAEEDVEIPIQSEILTSSAEIDSARLQRKVDSLPNPTSLISQPQIQTQQQQTRNDEKNTNVHTQLQQQQQELKQKQNTTNNSHQESNLKKAKQSTDLQNDTQTLSQVSGTSSKNNLSSSQISEISRAKREQAKKWSELMNMLEDFDASNSQNIIEQIKMRSQQNYNQLNSELLNKSQQSGNSSNRSNKQTVVKQEIKYPEVSVLAAEDETNSYQLDESVAGGEQSLEESAIGKRMYSHEDELTSASQILQHHWRRQRGTGATSQGHQYLHSPNLHCQDGEDEGSSTGGSVFEAAPFQDFAQKKYKEFLQQSSQQKLEQSINDEDDPNNNNNSVQQQQSLNNSSSIVQNMQTRVRQRRHSGDNDDEVSQNSSSSPYGSRMHHTSSPTGTAHGMPLVSPRAYDTKQVDLSNSKSQSQQQQQQQLSGTVVAAAAPPTSSSHQQQQLQGLQHNNMISSSSSTSSIVRTQRDLMFIQKMRAMNLESMQQHQQQQQQSSSLLISSNNSGLQGQLRINLALSSGPAISSPLKLTESQSCKHQNPQQTLKYSQFLASGEQSLSQSSFTRLAQSSFICASQGEMRSSNIEDRVQQSAGVSRNNIVVIDQYKPIDLKQRNNNNKVTGCAVPIEELVGQKAISPSPWATTSAACMEDVESVTSEEENMENSAEDSGDNDVSEEALNKKLQAMHLLEPAAFEDLEDLERDRRDFEEAYKNLESTEKKSAVVTTKTNSNGEKQYFLEEESIADAQGTFFAQEDLLQETPKDDNEYADDFSDENNNNNNNNSLQDSQDCGESAGARPFEDDNNNYAMSSSSPNQKYNVDDIHLLSDNQSMDTVAWNSANSSQVLPATPAQFLKQRYGTRSQQSTNLATGTAAAGTTGTTATGATHNSAAAIAAGVASDATVTPSNGGNNQNSSSINWDKEMLLSGCPTSEKKQQSQQQQQQPSIIHLITQQVDTTIEKYHLTNQYAQSQQRDGAAGASSTPNLNQEPSISNLYSNYHNNYSLSDERVRNNESTTIIAAASAATAVTAAPTGPSTIAQQIYMNNLIHAQHGKQIPPRSADKLSDFNYSASKQGDDDYILDEGLYDSVNQATPMQMRNSQKNELMFVGNTSEMNYESEVFENESAASAAATATAPAPDGLQQSNLQNSRGGSATVMTVDDCISEESDSNEPVSMNQGNVLPNHDTMQDEMPSIHTSMSGAITINHHESKSHFNQQHRERSEESQEQLRQRSRSPSVDTIADNILKSLLQEFSQELLQKPQMHNRFRAIHTGEREEVNHRHLQVGPQHDDDVYDEFEGDQDEEDEEDNEEQELQDEGFDQEQDVHYQEKQQQQQNHHRFNQQEQQQHQQRSDDKNRSPDNNTSSRNHLHSSQQSPQQQYRDHHSNSKYRKRMQGIHTEMAAVRTYLTRLCDYILDTYLDSFVERINISLGPSAIEMLKFLHFSDANQSIDGGNEGATAAGAGSSQLDTSSSEVSLQHQAVLTTDLYSAFEMLLLEEKAISAAAMASQNSEELFQFRITSKDITHIHNKVVFDALNEALDSHRIYGLKGRPFPWRIDATKICKTPILREGIPEILLDAQKRVLEWARCKCGVIFDKQDSGYSYYNLTEEYITQTKERHLTAMLHGEVRENEEKWIIYDDEYTEIQVEISEYVFDELITQAARDLADLQL